MYPWYQLHIHGTSYVSMVPAMYPWYQLHIHGTSYTYTLVTRAIHRQYINGLAVINCIIFVCIQDDLSVQLAFNYLLAKDKLEWITVTGPHTILLSMLLQSVVSELILNIKQMKIRKVLCVNTPILNVDGLS